MTTTELTKPRRRGIRGGLLLAFGIVISIVGSAVLTGGILVASANQLRDSQGYFAAPTQTFTTQTYALTLPALGEITVTSIEKYLPLDPATIRISTTSAGSDTFIGIAPKADIDHYLDGVNRTEIRNVQYLPFRVEYRDVPGSHAPTPPPEQHFWTESAAGRGAQEIQWSVVSGEWGVVVMNADGSSGVTADLQAAVRSDLISPVATLVIVVGAVLLLIGIPMLIVGAVSLRRRDPSEKTAQPASTSTAVPTATP